jgi:hypothetical protein
VDNGRDGEVYYLFAEVETPQPAKKVLQGHGCPVPGVGFRCAPGFAHKAVCVVHGKNNSHPVTMCATLLDAGGVIHPHHAWSWHLLAVPLGDGLHASEEGSKPRHPRRGRRQGRRP